MHAYSQETAPPSTACELFRRCLAGDHGWTEFVRRHERRLRLTLRRALGPRYNEADLEDCLQDLYLRLLRLDNVTFRGRNDSQLFGFLDQTARRLVRDRHRSGRSERRYRRHIRSGACDASARPEQERQLVARQEIDRYLGRCRRALESTRASKVPLELRLRVLRLALIDGYSSREIARQTGGRLSAAQIDSMIHRLRRKLVKHGIAIPRRSRCGAIDAA